MPTPRVVTSKIRQALQPLTESGLSTRQVAALGMSKTAVSEIAIYARDAGVDWPQAANIAVRQKLPVASSIARPLGGLRSGRRQ